MRFGFIGRAVSGRQARNSDRAAVKELVAVPICPNPQAGFQGFKTGVEGLRLQKAVKDLNLAGKQAECCVHSGSDKLFLTEV
jgi:hypothetical protein